MWLRLRHIFILSLSLLTVATVGGAVLHAAPEPVAQSAPHIGYGIHVAPWTEVPPSTVTNMGFDWVKLYNPEQARAFSQQRQLYRIDVRGMPDSIDGSYEADMRTLAAQLSRQGVDAVEIGNEPNLGAEWGNTRPNPADYVRVLEVAYRAFKQAAPNIIVVSAGLAPTLGTADGMNMNDLTYAQGMLNAGAARHFDVFGYHPYGFDRIPEADPNSSELLFRRTERIYSLLLANGVRDKEVWLTEFGWMRDPAENGLNCAGVGDFQFFAWSTHTQAEQASYLVRAFEFADRNWPWVGPMFLWNLDWNVRGNSEVGPCSHLRLFSIMDINANPYPAYYALQQMDKRYVNYGVPVVRAVIDPPLFDPHNVGRVNGMTVSVEANCAGLVRLGSFTVVTAGYPNTFTVDIEAANGPGIPHSWTSEDTATNGTSVEVFVDARGVQPGLHQIAINLSTDAGDRLSTYNVRGWLLVHYPTGEACGG